MKLNIFPSNPASLISIRMPCLHVKSYAFFMSKKLDTTCSLFAWTFLTVASRDKSLSIVFRLALPPHCSVDNVLSDKKNPTALQIPFSPLVCIEHLLKQSDDNLKGSLGSIKFLILLSYFVVHSKKRVQFFWWEVFQHFIVDLIRTRSRVFGGLDRSGQIPF